MRAGRLIALAAFLWGGTAPATGWADDALPDMGPAPEFSLSSTEGDAVSLASLRGKVVVVAFIYTWCPDICPLLTENMARVQDDLGDAFGRDVAFVSITFDPERDTPDVLRSYAEAFDANPAGWRFLTGSVDTVRAVARSYGVVLIPEANSSISHNLLTSLIDRHGHMRVQYAGFRFDPDEMRRDILALMMEE